MTGVSDLGNPRSWAPAAAALIAIAVPATPALAAPAPVPCHRIGGGKYECSWWRPGDGRTAGSIVVRDGKVVGYLHQGRNWIVCQQKGAEVDNEAGDRNHWYGWTQSDHGGTGWASALDARGGDDFGAFAKAPNCDGKYGAAPRVAGRWSTRPPSGGASPPPSDSPPPPSGGDGAPKPDKGCSDTRNRLTATARFNAHVHGVYQAKRRKKLHLRRLEGLDERFWIGSVAIRSAGCKRNGRWRPFGEPHVKVSSAALSRKGGETIKSAGAGGLGTGWGVMIGRYSDKGVPLLTINVVQCLPDGWAQFRGFLELLGLGTGVSKIRHPYSAWIAVGVYLVDKWSPEGGVECRTLNAHTFRVGASARRLVLSHVGERGGDVAARFDSEERRSDGSRVRQVLMADIGWPSFASLTYTAACALAAP